MEKMLVIHWFLTWIVGMVFTATVSSEVRSPFQWARTCFDVSAFSLLLVACLAGMSWLSKRSDVVLGVPEEVMWGIWCVVCARAIWIAALMANEIKDHLRRIARRSANANKSNKP